MKEKHIKIEIPEGYEIDKQRSTFECIVFKKLENVLPKTWEELKRIEGYCVVGDGTYNVEVLYSTHNKSKSVFPTKEEAEACIALAQLCQLRDRYNTGEDGEIWKPDWNIDIRKEIVCIQNEEIFVSFSYHVRHMLAFRSLFLCDHFANTFKDLIHKAKPLL